MITKKSYIKANLQFMAQAEVMDMITAGRYEAIKDKDAEPQFRVYSVGHEGEAQGREIGGGILVTKWFRNAIRTLADRVKPGVMAFFRHGADNSHKGREGIGEIVGGKVKEIGGILHSLVVAYIYPAYRSMDLDVASIEADILYDPIGKEITGIENVTGIALGNSREGEKPGFPGATLQACYQMFAQENRETDKGRRTEMNLTELKEAVSSGGYIPSQLFGKEVLERDPVVVEIAHGKSQAEHEHRKRTDAKFDEARAEWEKEKADLKAEAEKANLKLLSTRTGEFAKELSGKRNLTEKQSKFLEKNLGKFQPKETDEVKAKEELNKFIDTALEEYAEYAKLMGIEDKGENKPGDTGAPPAGGEENAPADDNLDPQKNDLIP